MSWRADPFVEVGLRSLKVVREEGELRREHIGQGSPISATFLFVE